MSDDLIFILEDAQDLMQKALSHLESELIKIRAGKANPQMLQRECRRCTDPNHSALGEEYAAAYRKGDYRGKPGGYTPE
jgi:hypothetical protein